MARAARYASATRFPRAGVRAHGSAKMGQCRSPGRVITSPLRIMMRSGDARGDSGSASSANVRRLPGERRRHHLAGLLLHLLEMLGSPERLGVDLVDILGAGRPRGEPGVLGGDLQPADGGAVTRGGDQPRSDLL